MDTIENKRVFITGGAQGIGKALVKAFHKAGAKVAFCDVNTNAGEQLANSLPETTFFQTVDVSDEQLLTKAFQGVLDAWGDIDILINNAGISLFSPLTETPVDRFDHILATNLRPVFILSRLWAIHRDTPEGKERYGRIINLASTRYLQSEPGSEGYAASKGGIVSLTHALAISLNDYNITVNCISPGWIQTKDYEKLTHEDHSQHPSGRVGRPDDIAGACLFLCQPSNDFINGQNITIDGGMTKKMIYEE